jgi:hypothetical protein
MNPYTIVIGDKPAATYLLAVISRGTMTDEIILQFTDQNAGQAEYLLRLLRKGAGWCEVGDREKAVVQSNTCVFKDRHTGRCTCEEINYRGACTEPIRTTCEKYCRNTTLRPISVNQVLIEKVAQARGL